MIGDPLSLAIGILMALFVVAVLIFLLAVLVVGIRHRRFEEKRVEQARRENQKLLRRMAGLDDEE